MQLGKWTGEETVFLSSSSGLGGLAPWGCGWEVPKGFQEEAGSGGEAEEEKY